MGRILIRRKECNKGIGFGVEISCRFFAFLRKIKILILFGNQDSTVSCFSLLWCHQES